MLKGYKFGIALFMSTFITLISSQVYPERYTFVTGTSVNGSSPIGNCSMTTCLQPTSSVLFDGHVPTLTGLDGDMWASQLLTINTMESLTNVIFDFTDTPGYVGIQRVEVVMFDCPQWGIASTTITVTGATARGQTFITFASTSASSLTSCESLVRVCLSAFISQSLISLQFSLDQDSDWVHLAEVIFYARGSTCPPNIILTSSPFSTPPISPPPAIPSDEISSNETSITSHGTPQSNITTSHGTPPSNITTLMGSIETSNIATTIIAAVVPLSIVLIIVIIVVVLILCIVCTTKYKHQLRAKEDHTTTHRQTHNHQPPLDRGHINLCEETGQAYYSSLHDIQGEDISADQIHNCLQQDAGPVRGGAKSSRGATVDQNEVEVGAYSTVSYSKQPQASREVIVECMEDPLSQLYTQVDEDIKKPKKKSEATDQQEEASAFALYARVDEKRKKKKMMTTMKKEEDTPSHEPDQLYAQVDKKKKKEDSPPPELDQLYAQVDKKKRKKEKEDSPPPEPNQLYAQVDKKRKKREKEKTEEVSPQESGDVYSVVNKPSAPPVPLKSDLFMEELQ